MPEEAKPQETKPEEAKPQETKPEEAKPQETKPEEAKPQETKPEEAKPEETKAGDTKAHGGKADEARAECHQAPAEVSYQEDEKAAARRSQPSLKKLTQDERKVWAAASTPREGMTPFPIPFPIATPPVAPSLAQRPPREQQNHPCLQHGDPPTPHFALFRRL